MTATSEAEILRDVHLRLGSRADVRLWRFNAGSGWVKTRKGFVPQPFCPAGYPDLAGWLTVDSKAIWLGVECKSEGGKLRPEQKLWREWVTKAGGVYVVAHSADEAEQLLERAIKTIKEV